MRYVTAIVTPTVEQVRSMNHQYLQVGDDPRQIWVDDTLIATQEAIQYLNLLDDGTVVAIIRFRGDADQFAMIEDEISEIISCTVTGGETWLAYMHYEPDEFQTALLEGIDTEAISIDWPMRKTADGLEVTFFGEDAALQQMIAGIPDGIDLTLKRAGNYQTSITDPVGQLTDRQKEVVRAAITAGYYDIPRRATQSDLAAELGLSQGTIGDHLRRIEAKIIKSVIV